MAADIDIKWKTALRIAFPVLLRTDDDLFLFSKYALHIAKLQNHKGFSRTARKAITSWYEMRTPEAIRTMWMAHRGLHGFTHKALIKLCHISDGTIGSAEVSTLFFKTCTELINESEKQSEAATTNGETANEEEVKETSPVLTTDSNANETKVNDLNVQSNSAPKPPASASDLSMAVSKLRVTKKNHDALKIIRKYKLPYHQVPGHFLGYAPIMAQLLPSMPYLQVLKCWRRMAKNKHFENQRIFKLCKSRLENKELARKTNIHPVQILINMHDIGIVSGDLTKLPNKKVEAYKMQYLNQLYRDSFQWQAGCGKLRMHITLNLQSNYKKSKYHLT